MLSLTILVSVVLTIGTCTIQDLPMYLFNVSSPSGRQVCTNSFLPKINFTGWKLPIDDLTFISTTVRCFEMKIQTNFRDLTIFGGTFVAPYSYDYAYDTSAADNNQHQELARQYLQKGFPSLVNNSSSFDTINVFTFNVLTPASNWRYQIVIATHSGNQFIIFLYSNSSILSAGSYRFFVDFNGNLFQLQSPRNELPSITNIDIPGVFMLILNEYGVREPGAQFASIPEYFFDTTNSTVHGDAYTHIIFVLNLFVGGFQPRNFLFINCYSFKPLLFEFPHKSWLLQAKSIHPNSELGVDIGNTIKRGFPEYPGANNIILDTQQLWVKDMGVATYQFAVAGNDTNELYFIFLYGNINFSINATIGYGPQSNVIPLLSAFPQNSLKLYSNIDQPGVYVFKYNDTAANVLMPNLNCTDIGCLNGGTCIGTACVCLSSYTGSNCEVKITTTTVPSTTTTTEPSTTTFSSSPTINGTSDDSLDGGQIAGITVAVIVIIGILILAIVVVMIIVVYRIKLKKT